MKNELESKKSFAIQKSQILNTKNLSFAPKQSTFQSMKSSSINIHMKQSHHPMHKLKRQNSG